MAIRIKFDSSYNACSPTFVLATKNGTKLGAIPAHNIVVKDSMNNGSELSFSVYKIEKGAYFHLWNQVKDFKLMWCKEWDIWFELHVELDESNELIKRITAKSLGEAELSQIKLYNIEINTESDISNDDYVPTVLFDDSNPKASLLNRIMEKAPHYTINHVDSSICNIQRTFSFDDITIYDALQQVSEEINCLFIIDSGSDVDGRIKRSINVYDLESYCMHCNNRGEFLDSCPECGNEDILTGYGQDTSIFVSTDNLADSITYSSDVDSVKNCFKLVAGDDTMTAALINCNPNGSGYIWHISDEMKEDMSYDLTLKLREYDEKYNYYQKDHQVTIPSSILDEYNSLVGKYNKFSNDLITIPESIVGYPSLMKFYYDVIDFYLFLSHRLMPNVDMQDTTATIEASKLTSDTLSPVAVQDLEKCSSVTASNAVLAMAKTIVDSRYKVKVSDGVLDGSTWTGGFIITNYSDETDMAEVSEISVSINDDYENFVRQKLEKALHKKSDDIYGIVDLFKLDENAFINELKKYSLSRLMSFNDSCQTCIDILIEHGVSNNALWEDQSTNLYEEIYVPYYNKLAHINSELKVRENEISVLIGCYDKDGDLVENGVQTIIEQEKDIIQTSLNFEKFLGEQLWLELVAYRREDTYKNDNYISDGLNNSELFKNALEFIETAKKDIFKSATLQHSISATLKNLLVMNEFSPIVDYFEVGNWIRVKADNVIYKLRIIDYEVDFDNLDHIAITFSDVKTVSSGINDIESILNQASSMASSYGSISRQAGHGEKSNKQLDHWVTEGLALTNMKIVGSAENQNITWDSHGLLCKEYLPITDNYDEKQLKLINRGIYLTDDNWLTSRTGIGDFTFYNPQTGQMEETYGVIADTLVGNLILSEKVGIYNTRNSITLDQNGVIITADNTTDALNQTSFTIQKKTIDSDGNECLTQIMYIDSDGHLVLNGSIRINTTSDASISTLDELADNNRFDVKIKEFINNELNRPADEDIDGDTGGVYPTINSKYQEVYEHSEKILNEYKAVVGQYMQFDDYGLTLGSTESRFKTVIDNQGMYFKEGDSIVSYVNNSQLHIPNAVIENTLILGSFFFSPRSDGGVSLTWQG